MQAGFSQMWFLRLGSSLGEHFSEAEFGSRRAKPVSELTSAQQLRIPAEFYCYGTAPATSATNPEVPPRRRKSRGLASSEAFPTPTRRLASGPGWAPAAFPVRSGAVSREHRTPGRRCRKLRPRPYLDSAGPGARPVWGHERDRKPAAGPRGTLPAAGGELREATASLLPHHSL